MRIFSVGEKIAQRNSICGPNFKGWYEIIQNLSCIFQLNMSNTFWEKPVFVADAQVWLRHSNRSFHMRKTNGIRTFSGMKFSFYIWYWNLFTYKIPDHMRNELVQNVTWNLCARNMYFISHMDVKQFTCEILFSYVEFPYVLMSIKVITNFKCSTISFLL